MRGDGGAVSAQLLTIEATRVRNLELLAGWMEVAARMLEDPTRVSGKELNLTHDCTWCSTPP